MGNMNLEQARFNMIEQQVRPWEVLDPRVLEVLSDTPREAFVPEQYRTLAFADIEIPLDHGQKMMPPKLEGRMLQALNVQPGDRVLEIGTGSGFITACLTNLGGQVTTVEIHADMQAAARDRLEEQNILGVTYKEGDAARGWESNQAFDVVAITGSLPILHRGFHDCLNIGGRLFVVVGNAPTMSALLITRQGPSEWSQEDLFEIVLAPLVNAEVPPKFAF